MLLSLKAAYFISFLRAQGLKQRSLAAQAWTVIRYLLSKLYCNL